MPTKFEEIGHVGGFKPFSVVLEEFINSKQNWEKERDFDEEK